MSKAFTKEPEGDADDDDDPREEDRGPRGPRLITPEGYRALQQELSHLWKVLRPKVTEEVAVAAAHGDRSENAEYIYGKKKLREIDRKIRFLTKRLEKLTVVGETPKDPGRVFFGAWVTIADEYRLVGADEIDLAKRHISMDAPIARALIGKALGDVVVVDRPKGPAELEIVDIRYAPPPAPPAD